MRTPGALAIAVLATGGALIGCAGGGGGGGGGAPPKAACKPPLQATVFFSSNIQPIFNHSCALTSCHVPPVPAGGQDLSAGAAYAQSVNVPSTQRPRLKRIKPGDPDNSYLVRKLRGGPGIAGSMMPQGCPAIPPPGGSCLGPDDIPAIVQWITECALDN